MSDSILTQTEQQVFSCLFKTWINTLV